ncbi:NADH-quinone oxidoreductase subunit N [Lacipirellula parvula]|uniref:NADH-quinone oxidoreductase subunit N n=1 Tax=Lacipirellula parvula TaxID=2650471 RepID=A0A5K7X7R6_9BACT|nr:NADH-quinone oxidoreductase subunit N [Lacipirellula parvula]BBO32608.1 NADH-ubiquinone oxidoreductase chain N [Lacipirellula parvula]
MNLHEIVDNLISDTVQTSLPRFGPELALCVTIVVLLLTRVLPLLDRIPPVVIAFIGSLAAFVAAIPPDGLGTFHAIEREELFTGLLVYDGMTAYFRLFLMAFAVLFVVLSQLTGIADREDGQDYFSLVFGATIGMCIMVSSNHLLTMFLGVEMASVPSYVLAGIVKGRRRSSEAALKYAVYGAGAAGVMLYGTSLVAGLLGSAHFPTLTQRLIEFDLPTRMADRELTVMVLALAGLMVGVGLAFKLSAVPFHFWCPDVFEGASAEVGAFLSVASKAAALALLVRVAVGFSYESPTAAKPGEPSPHVAASEQEHAAAPIRLVAQHSTANQPGTSAADAETPLGPVRSFLITLIGVVSIVTCTFGNLAAYGQRNIKRMLAYSTIAHAGFMMMPVAAAVALLGEGRTAAASEAISALMLYAAIYLFMNLGAFSIIAFLRNSMQSEEIKDYAGLINRSPVIAVAFTLILFSLVGLPPLAGFWPKLRVLQALFESHSTLLTFVMVVAAANTALSLVYYLRVAKTMCIDGEPDSTRPVSLGFLQSAFVLAMTLPVVIYGVLPNSVAAWAQSAASGLFH